MSAEPSKFKDHRRFFTPEQHRSITDWWRLMSRPIWERRDRQKAKLGPSKPLPAIQPPKPVWAFRVPTPQERQARQKFWAECAAPINERRQQEFEKLRQEQARQLARQNAPGPVARLVKLVRRNWPTNG